MHTYFINHKLSVGDSTHLSDSDSERVINSGDIQVESIITVSTLDGIWTARVTDIGRKSVEIEILEKLEDLKKEDAPFSISIIQSLSNATKFNIVVEKAVELGVTEIIPVQSKYSKLTANKAIKKLGLWRKIVSDAVEQSRNPYPTLIAKPIRINSLKDRDFQNFNKLCLSTEEAANSSLPEYFGSVLLDKPTVVAIGPETGWSSSDLETLRSLDFKFVRLKGNILRTETASLAIVSIFNYLTGKF